MIQKYTSIIIQTTDIVDTIIYRIYKQNWSTNFICRPVPLIQNLLSNFNQALRFFNFHFR